MYNMIIDLAIGRPISDDVIIEHLSNICEDTHASCNSKCPVYALNDFKIPDSAHDFNVNRGCDCFKSGTKMLNFIRRNSIKFNI